MQRNIIYNINITMTFLHIEKNRIFIYFFNDTVKHIIIVSRDRTIFTSLAFYYCSEIKITIKTSRIRVQRQFATTIKSVFIKYNK
jgi:hypothetical protein